MVKQYKPIDFKWRHYEGEVILLCLRWYLRYRLSYRNLSEMMNERGLDIVGSTVYRWVQHYSPELQKKVSYLYCFNIFDNQIICSITQNIQNYIFSQRNLIRSKIPAIFFFFRFPKIPEIRGSLKIEPYPSINLLYN